MSELTDKEKIFKLLNPDGVREGHWFCIRCDEEMPPTHVSFEECCEICDCPVIWKEPTDYSTPNGIAEIKEWLVKEGMLLDFSRYLCNNYHIRNDLSSSDKVGFVEDTLKLSMDYVKFTKAFISYCKEKGLME